VDLVSSEGVELNDKVGQKCDKQKMAENVSGVKGEYTILRLLADYFL